jgi:hypothetical protein
MQVELVDVLMVMAVAVEVVHLLLAVMAHQVLVVLVALGLQIQ